MLKDYLEEPDCLGVMRSVDGTLTKFRRHGVADLLRLVETEPALMHGSSVADRVVGKGAALLMLAGKVGSVYAQVISSGALRVLRRGGVMVSFGVETPYIKNRKDDGMCPVESLVADTEEPAEAVRRIKTFIESINK